MAEDYTARFRVDISDLKKNISEAQKQIKLANATFKAETAGMDKWEDSAEGLSKKLAQLRTVLTSQKSILDSYRQQLTRQEEAYKENGNRAEQLKAKLRELASQGVDKASDEYKKYADALKKVEKEQEQNEKSVDQLRIKVLNAEAAYNKTDKELRNYEKDLDKTEHEVEDLTDAEQKATTATSQMGDGFTVLKGVVSNLVTQGLRKAKDELKDLITDGAEYADTINTMASKTGLGTDTLQKLDYMSGLVDVDVNTVAKSMTKLTKTMSSAQGGGKSATEAFEKLGVSVVDANGNLRDNEDVFYEVIEALGNMDNETERNAEAMKIFGKSATDLNPMIEAGAKQLKAWSDEAEDMGYIMSEDMIDGLVELNDSFDRLKNGVKAAKNQIAAGLAPAVKDGTKKLLEMSQSVDWKAFGKKLGDALKILIDAFKWVIDNGPIVKSVLAGILAAFAAQKIAGVVQSIGNMTKALLTMNAAASANPYVLLAEALIGVSIAVGTWLESMDEARIAESYVGEQLEALDEQMAEHQEAIDDMVASYEAMDEIRTNSISSAESEAEYLQDLTDELGTLVDANGEVQDADKARADFILNELNTALGTEYDMNDLLNGKYQEMKDSIYELIEAKRIEAILAAQQEGFTQAVGARSDAELELSKIVQDQITNENELNAAISERDRLVSQVSDSLRDENKDRIEGLNLLIDKYEEQKTELQENYQTCADIVNKYAYDMKQYEDNLAAAHEKNYEKMSTTSYEAAKRWKNNVEDYASEVATKTKESSNDWLTYLGKMVSSATGKNVDFKNAGRGMVDAYVNGQKEKEGLPAEEISAIAKQMMRYQHVLEMEMQASAKNIPGGIAQGIYDNAGVALSAMSWLASQLQITFNKSNESKSPSRKYMRYTGYILQGIVKEIDKDGYKAENAMKSLADGMMNTFDTEMAKDRLSGISGLVKRTGNKVVGVDGSETITGENGVIVNNNYTQINNSPKQLSRREIYRQTKNLLALTGRA